MTGYQPESNYTARDQVIKRVIKARNMVLVFDESGEQIPEYQGQYNTVKPQILKAAPPSTLFHHVPGDKSELLTVPREAW